MYSKITRCIAKALYGFYLRLDYFIEPLFDNRKNEPDEGHSSLVNHTSAYEKILYEYEAPV